MWALLGTLEDFRVVAGEGGGVGEEKEGEGGGLRSKTSTPCSNGGVLGRLFRGKQVYFLLLGAQLVLQESQPRPLLSLSI